MWVLPVQKQQKKNQPLLYDQTAQTPRSRFQPCSNCPSNHNHIGIAPKPAGARGAEAARARWQWGLEALLLCTA